MKLTITLHCGTCHNRFTDSGDSGTGGMIIEGFIAAAREHRWGIHPTLTASGATTHIARCPSCVAQQATTGT